MFFLKLLSVVGRLISLRVIFNGNHLSFSNLSASCKNLRMMQDIISLLKEHSCEKICISETTCNNDGHFCRPFSLNLIHLKSVLISEADSNISTNKAHHGHITYRSIIKRLLFIHLTYQIYK